MRAAVHPHLETLRLRDLALGVCVAAAPRVASAVHSARGRAAEREPGCPVGMEHSKRLDRESIPHDRPDEAVAAVFTLAETVAVLDPHLVSRNGSFPWAKKVFDADIVAEDFSAPAVVIPGRSEERRVGK